MADTAISTSLKSFAARRLPDFLAAPCRQTVDSLQREGPTPSARGVYTKGAGRRIVGGPLPAELE